MTRLTLIDFLLPSPLKRYDMLHTAWWRNELRAYPCIHTWEARFDLGHLNYTYSLPQGPVGSAYRERATGSITHGFIPLGAIIQSRGNEETN